MSVLSAEPSTIPAWYNFTEENTEDMFFNTYTFQLLKVSGIFVYCVIIFLGITGNALVIWIAGFKMKKTVNTIWYLNLAVCDLLVNILILPTRISSIVYDNRWPFGQAMCKLLPMLNFLYLMLSVSFLMVISIDRCLFILKPLWTQRYRRPRVAYTVSVVTWLFCIILSSPYPAFYNAYTTEYAEVFCYVTYATANSSKWKERHIAMTMTRFVSMFLIPFSIILICYGLILVRLRTSRRRTFSGRTLRVIIAVVTCFFCCKFLHHLFDILTLTNTYIDVKIYVIMREIAYILTTCNSCMNPILYVFIGRNFKESLRKSIPFVLENIFTEKF